MSEYISSDQVSSSVILDSGNMPVSDGGAAKGALSSLVVTTAADVVDANDGVTSLREALAAAMSGVTAADGTYTITFDRSLAGKTITLNSELLVTQNTFTTADRKLTINGDIDGSGNADITLDGNNWNNSIVFVESGNYSVINGLIFTNGHRQNGGALNNLGVMTVSNCVFSGNKADDGGGAIVTPGTLTVVNSIFEDNYARYGGAIFVAWDGVATVINSTLKNNSAGYSTKGGAIQNGWWCNSNDNRISVLNSVLVGNTAGGAANDIGNESGKTAKMKYSVVTAVDGFSPDGTNYTGYSANDVLNADATLKDVSGNPAISGGVKAGYTASGAAVYSIDGTNWLTIDGAACNEAVTVVATDYAGTARTGSYSIGAYQAGTGDISPLVVTTAADVVDANDGKTSLREAISYAQSLGGKQTITFDIEDGNTISNLSTNIILVDGLSINGYNRASQTNIIVVSQSQFHVYENASLSNITVGNRSSDRISGDIKAFGGYVQNVTISQYGDFYSLSGSHVSNVTILSEGSFITEETNINNLLVEYGGLFVYSDGDILSGTITIAGATEKYIKDGACAVTLADAHITLDISGWTPGGRMDYSGNHEPAYITDVRWGTTPPPYYNLIEDISVFSGTATYTVSVKADQAVGTYKLAGNAANFAVSMSLTVGEETYANALTVGNAYSVGGRSYSLALDDGNVLTLTVAASAPLDPLVVTTVADVVDANDGVTSLREAITYAQSLGGEQTITFNMTDGDTVYINDPSLVSRNLRFGATNAANGNAVTVVLNELSISGRSLSTSAEISGGTVMPIDGVNIKVIGGAYSNNSDSGVVGNGGVFVFENCKVDIDGTTFENNYAFSRGGAIGADNSSVTIRNCHFEGNNVYGWGGALNLYDGTKAIIVDTDFVNNSTRHSTYYYWNGGAIKIEGSNLVYEVSADKTVNNIGNDSSHGGFISVRTFGDIASVAEFKVNGTLNIGTGDGKDSIVTDPTDNEYTNIIRKTGVGTMTVNAPTSDYDGEWIIEDGVLNMTYGGDFDGDITVSGGQLQLDAAYTFKKLSFVLGETNDTPYISDLAKLTGGTFSVDAGAAAVGTYKLAGNAAGFDSAMSLTVGESTYADALTVGNTYSVGGRDYSLAVDGDNTLSLTVTEGEMPPSAFTPGDLNGDGRADIVMTIAKSGHLVEGATGAWLISNTQTAAWGDLSKRNTGWEIFGMWMATAGKTTNDVYVKSSDNVIGAWTTDATGKVAGWTAVGEFDANTQILGLGDFNGDGQSDLLLRNTNGAVGCYFTSGAKRGWNYFQSLGNEWTISAVGDLNGDGRDDVVLKHAAGFAGSWLTQSDYTMAWAGLDTLKDGYAIVGTGDFNGDGIDDVLLRNGGYCGAWLVQDGNAAAWLGLGDIGTAAVEQIADFDGDGKDDLRIRTTAGDLGAMLVKGEDTLQWRYYGSVGNEWSTSLAAI